MSEAPTGELSGLLDAGISTFMGFEHLELGGDGVESGDVDVGVVGFPFDSTCLSRSGANRGPRVIRDVSCQTHPYHFEYDVNLEETYRVVDCGDVPVIPGDSNESLARGEDWIGRLLDADVFPVLMGGDHSSSIAGFRAFGKRVDEPGLVVLDAHLDTAQDVGGTRYNHACPVARAIDECGFDPRNICLVGITGTGNPAFEREIARQRDVNVFPLDEIIERGPEEVATEVATIVGEGTDAVYLSCDIDVLDAAYAPGTGVPTPGGLSARELLQLIGGIASRDLDAMDVVEVSPQWDHSNVTALMAVRIIVDALAAKATGDANAPGLGTSALRSGVRSN